MGVHPPQNGGIGYDPWPSRPMRHGERQRLAFGTLAGFAAMDWAIWLVLIHGSRCRVCRSAFGSAFG